jgi:hypothetical protein
MNAILHPPPDLRCRAAPLRAVLGLVLVATLSACGGGSDDEPVSTLPTAADIVAAQDAIDGPLAGLAAPSGLPSDADIVAAQNAIDAGTAGGDNSADAITAQQDALDATNEFE